MTGQYMARGSNEYVEMVALIQKTLEPLISNLSKVDAKVDRAIDKVDELARDHVTRADIEKLRSEIQSSFVLRAEYDPKHETLIAQITSLTAELRRVDNDRENDSQRIHERLESGKQQIEDRIKQEEERGISARERWWMRSGIIFSVLLTIATVMYYLAGHVQLH